MVKSKIKKVRRDYTQKLTKEFDKEYVRNLFDMLSILHDMKHDGTLPKKLHPYMYNVIEFFSPDKLGIEEK